MNKTVVIHQPDFVPYLGFFQRLLSADQFIVLDHVQFVTGTSRSWTHRDKIKTPAGEQWITLSVRKAPLGTPIDQIELSTSVDWATANLNQLKQNYRHAPFFDEVFPLVTQLYEAPPRLMVDFNLRSIELLMDLLDVRLPWVRSSSLQPEGSSNELLIDLLGKVGATHYLSGNGARGYMQPERFAQAGIEVVWQNFVHPVYPQQFGAFVPYLSSLDALFNCGIAATRYILRETI
ncbi:WbqC family protein [Laribacter hongkongensis]|uniref:WbqC family protein n=1 Tax=Laribacter hongkongensis TaxID=168471 RepID=UPI001EFD4947|nr:WbqC family protein [Laribacter hongkongensis]MCG9022856.1 WbqC family protein [Laribacter hongkongensis]